MLTEAPVEEMDADTGQDQSYMMAAQVDGGARPREPPYPRRVTFPHPGVECVKRAIDRMAGQSDSSDGSIVGSSSAPSDEAAVSRKMVVPPQPKFRNVDLAWLSRSAQQLQAGAEVEAAIVVAAAAAAGGGGGSGGGAPRGGDLEVGDDPSGDDYGGVVDHPGASEADAETSQWGDGGPSPASSAGSSTESINMRRSTSPSRDVVGAAAATAVSHSRAPQASYRHAARETASAMGSAGQRARETRWLDGGPSPTSSSSSSSAQQRRRSGSRSRGATGRCATSHGAPTAHQSHGTGMEQLKPSTTAGVQEGARQPHAHAGAEQSTTSGGSYEGHSQSHGSGSQSHGSGGSGSGGSGGSGSNGMSVGDGSSAASPRQSPPGEGRHAAGAPGATGRRPQTAQGKALAQAKAHARRARCADGGPSPTSSSGGSSSSSAQRRRSGSRSRRPLGRAREHAAPTAPASHRRAPQAPRSAPERHRGGSSEAGSSGAGSSGAGSSSSSSAQQAPRPVAGPPGAEETQGMDAEASP